MTIPIIFRKFNKGGDIIAIFPKILSDNRGNLESYQHIGQHGPCAPDLLQNITKKATKEEYQPLLNELISLGYDDLKIISRRTPKMRRELTNKDT